MNKLNKMALILLLTGGLFADSERVHFRWSWPFTGMSSGAIAVDSARHIAYYSSGLGVIGVDLYASPYSTVTRIFTADMAYGLATSADGTHLFAAVGTEGVEVWDVSDTANPTKVAVIDAGDARFLKVSGNYLFVSDSSSASVKIYDVSTPSSPSFVSSYQLSTGTPCEMEVFDTVLYMAGYNGGTYVLDISDISSPTLLTTLSEVAYYLDLDTAAHRLYIAQSMGFTGSSYLHFYDVTDPADPTYIFSRYIGNEIYGFGVSGDTVFVVSTFSGVVSYQIDWDNDTLLFIWSNSDGTLEHGAGLQLFEDKVLVASDRATDGNFYGVAKSNLATQDSALPQGAINDVFLNGDYVYFAARGIVTMHQVGDNAEYMGKVAEGVQFDELLVKGDYLIASTGDSIYIFDIGAYPAQPSSMGKFYSGGDLAGFDAVVSGKGLYIYVVRNDIAKIFVFDASNPSNVTLLYDIPTNYVPNDISVRGDTAYMTSSWDDKFFIFNMADSSIISVLGYDGPFGLEVYEDLAYVHGNNSRVIDISDPQTPMILGDITFNGSSWTSHDVWPFEEGAVYIGNLGFIVVDTRDRNHLHFGGYFRNLRGHYGNGVYFRNYRIYAAFSSIGLQVFDLDSFPPMPSPAVLIEPINRVWVDTTVHFEWQDTTGIQGLNYILRVYRYSYIIDDTVTTTYYDAVITQKERFSWYITTFTEPGYTATSYTGSFRVDPDPPFGLNLLSPNNGSSISDSIVSFDWSDAQDTSSGLAGYRLLISTDSTFASYDSFSVSTSNLDLTITSYGTFYWKVIAIDSVGNTAGTGVWSFTREMPTPPTPALVSPTGGAWLNSTPVLFRWSGGGKHLKFAKSKLEDAKLDFRLAENGGKPEIRYIIEILSGDSTVVYDTLAADSVLYDLVDGTYRWHVKAFYVGGGESGWSPTDSFGVDVTPPSTVSLASPQNGSFLGSTTVQFDWSDANDATSGVSGYLLLVSTSSSFSSPDSFICSQSETTITLSESAYWWKVRAFDAAGNAGDFSEVFSFEIDTTAPNAPGLIAPVGGVWLSDTTVELSWSEVTFKVSGKSAPVSYILEVISSGSVVISDTVDTNCAEVLLSEGYYHWHVMAFDGAGNSSSWSPTDSFGVDITPPTFDSMTVWGDTSWFFGPFEVHAWITDNLSGASNVWLFYSLDGRPADSVQMNESYTGWVAEIPAFPDSANHSVMYFVRAADASNPPNVSFSDTVSFSVTSIAENGTPPLNYSVRAVSLASRNILFEIASPMATNYTLRVYASDGRLVAVKSGRIEVGKHGITIGVPANGFYIAVLNTNLGKTVHKIVVLKK